MKKFLLGSTAIVAAAAVAAPAVAAEKITLQLGGYMQQYIGFASNEDDAGSRDYRTFDVQSDTEVHFGGSTTLDNGLKFAVKIEMEADGEDTNGTIDESWLEVSSASFGSLKLGYEDAVTSLAHNTSPNYGPGYGDADTWVSDSTVSKENDTYILIGQGDEAKISYFSPNFFGFQIGATYVPELEDGVSSGNASHASDIPNAVGGGGDAWMTTLSYKNEFGGVGVAADYGYGRATGRRAGDTNIKSADGHQVGLKVSFSGFEIGGAWQYTNQDHGALTGSANSEGSVWEAGVGYSQGPWGVSVGYMRSEQTGSLTDPDDDKWATVAVSGKYNLGPGIDVHGSLYYVDQEDESKVDANYNDGGWAVVAGFNLSF